MHASRRKPLHSESTKLGINRDICLLFARNVAAFLYLKLAVENLKGGDLVLLAELTLSAELLFTARLNMRS